MDKHKKVFLIVTIVFLIVAGICVFVKVRNSTQKPINATCESAEKDSSGYIADILKEYPQYEGCAFNTYDYVTEVPERNRGYATYDISNYQGKYFVEFSVEYDLKTGEIICIDRSEIPLEGN